MNRSTLFGHAILWAAAIVAAAIVGAPAALSTIVLPVLGATAVLLGARRRDCAPAARPRDAA